VALTLAVIFAVVSAIALFVGVLHLLHLELPPRDSDEQKNLIEVVKAALGLAVGVGAVVALVVTTRRQRVAEAGSHRDDSRLFTERYSTAAEQLGHEKAAVRLAGVYAMSRLADDWEEQRQICIDVLCAYLRMPYPAAAMPTASPTASLEAIPTETSASDNSGAGEREVRLTIIRVIRDHLRPSALVSWQGKDFDFTGATFDGGSFDGAEFSGGEVFFFGARFPGGKVHFNGARFSGGTVHFGGAWFSGGTVHFDRARFSGGEVHFNTAEFSGGEVYFDRAQFSGGMVDFGGARFSGGMIDFRSVQDWSVLPVGLPNGPTPGLMLPSVSPPV
jgi:hypothetical protein